MRLTVTCAALAAFFSVRLVSTRAAPPTVSLPPEGTFVVSCARAFLRIFEPVTSTGQSSTLMRTVW